MNMIMFTPMNGRRSLRMRRNICTPQDELNLKLSNVAMEAIRYYIKSAHRNQNDTDYLNKFKNDTFSQTIMKHIIRGLKSMQFPNDESHSI